MRYVYGLIFCFLTCTAAAQPACGPRTELVKHLADRYGEAQVGIGLDASGRLVEIFASTSGTFTVILSMPDGNSCVATTGKSWRTDGFVPIPKGTGL